jgi:hypothetical protein
MTLVDFTDALEQELRLRGVAFSRGELLAFMDGIWPLAREEPDVDRWAEAFLATDHGEQVV